MEHLKGKRICLTREKKEVVLLHRSNPSWMQQQLLHEFNQKHVAKDMKINLVSLILERLCENLKEAMSPKVESTLVTWFMHIHISPKHFLVEML
jgi:hypothetical protein